MKSILFSLVDAAVSSIPVWADLLFAIVAGAVICGNYVSEQQIIELNWYLIHFLLRLEVETPSGKNFTDILLLSRKELSISFKGLFLLHLNVRSHVLLCEMKRHRLVVLKLHNRNADKLVRWELLHILGLQVFYWLPCRYTWKIWLETKLILERPESIAYFVSSLFTCFVYFNHSLRQVVRYHFCQGARYKFCPEVPRGVCYHPLHPVEVLICIAAWGVGRCRRSWVRLDARHDKKQLDDARDGKLQIDQAEGVHCAPVARTWNTCWVSGKSGEEVGLLPTGSRWDHISQTPQSEKPKCTQSKEQEQMLPKL